MEESQAHACPASARCGGVQRMHNLWLRAQSNSTVASASLLPYANPVRVDHTSVESAKHPVTISCIKLHHEVKDVVCSTE